MASAQSRQYEQFQAHPRGFNWRGADFGFEQIRNLFFSCVEDEEEGREAAALVITVDSGVKIPISFDGLSSYFARHIANLKHLYEFLSHQSFTHRLNRYLGEIGQSGFFTYDGCLFYPRTKIVCGANEIPVRATKLRKGNGFVELRKKNRSVLDTLKHRLHLSPFPRFSTETDSDVIFHLLDKLFGQRWKR
jgi:hypothetical protein